METLHTMNAKDLESSVSTFVKEVFADKEDAFFAYALKRAESVNPLSVNRSLMRIVQSTKDNNGVRQTTYKLPFMSKVCTITERKDGKFTRTPFSVVSYDAKGKKRELEYSPRDEGVYPTLEKAVNAMSVSYGRAMHTALMTTCIDSSIVVSRDSQASRIIVEKDAELAKVKASSDAKIAAIKAESDKRQAESDKKIAELQAMMQKLLDSQAQVS